MKKGRRKAREGALQILYQWESLNHGNTEEALASFEQNFSEDKTLDPFTAQLVRGVCSELGAIDSRIHQGAKHWRIDRMAMVDLNILRLGVYELFYCDDIPATVTINEMVELAKHFGTESSASFVNGILDKLKQDIDRPNKAK